MEERSMKKRFGEIEEKIRVTINEREEALERLRECERQIELMGEQEEKMVVKSQ